MSDDFETDLPEGEPFDAEAIERQADMAGGGRTGAEQALRDELVGANGRGTDMAGSGREESSVHPVLAHRGKHDWAGDGDLHYGRLTNPRLPGERPPLPRELPLIRRGLVRSWGPEGLFDRALRERNAINTPEPHVDPRRYAKWEKETLERASLWWVADPMCELLMKAAAEVPEDVTFADLPPVEERLVSGFAVFERPYLGHDVTDHELRVDAFVWGTTLLPPFRGGTEGVLAMTLSSYEGLWIPADFDRRINDETQSAGRLWAPLGRSDWPLGDPIGQAPWADMSEDARRSFVEDRRILAALWVLLHQKGLATTFAAGDAGPRHERRRAAREGYANVRIVTLRRAHHPAGEPTGEHMEHDHRWIVSGHWRNQPFGPGRAQRRLQWIGPYIKGPEDAPLRQPEVVHAWRQ